MNLKYMNLSLNPESLLGFAESWILGPFTSIDLCNLKLRKLLIYGKTKYTAQLCTIKKDHYIALLIHNKLYKLQWLC